MTRPLMTWQDYTAHAWPDGSLKIAVIGKYWHEDRRERDRNVYDAFRVADELIRRGHRPIVPVWRHYYSEHLQRNSMHGGDYSESFYVNWDRDDLETAEAGYLWAPSHHADLEARFLEEVVGVPVWRDMADVPVVGKEV